VPAAEVAEAPTSDEAVGEGVSEDLDGTKVDSTTGDSSDTAEIAKPAAEVTSEETGQAATEAEVADEPAVVEEPAEAAPIDEPEVAVAAAPAVTAPASDISAMIGSATVTGTSDEGVRCRVAPSDDAATLMVLKKEPRSSSSPSPPMAI
jgi:hypothetical protein